MYNSQWYNNLIKPPFLPNDDLFAPIWTFLYLTIFISLILYILEDKKEKIAGYIFWAIQIILNFLWSPVFFLFQQINLAFVVIILLDIFVILTIKKFYTISKLSALLLLPYLIWLLFATYLNFAYIILN